MNTLVLLWYGNKVAFVVSLFALGVAGYIWRTLPQKQHEEAKTWLIVAIVSALLTLPAAWLAFSVIRQGLFSLPELLANAELYLYLSLAGLGGSLVAAYKYQMVPSLHSLHSPGPIIKTNEMPPTQQPYQPLLPTNELPPTQQPYQSLPSTKMTAPPLPDPTRSGTHIPRSAPIGPTQQLDQPLRPVAWLVVRSSSRQGKSYPLDGSETIAGRDGRRCQIVLDYDSVSGQHAKIKQEQNHFWLYDLASTNGTYVNKRRIQQQRLEDGDVVALGSLEFVFKKA
jgi:hypothetical protein